MEEVECRAVIKHLCKKGNMENLGKESCSYSTVKNWAAEFKRKRQSIEDAEQSGCPKGTITDENVETKHSLVMCDRR